MLIPRNAGDVHIYGHGRWSVAICLAIGLHTLEFVQCSVEAALYRSLVARELGKGVRPVCVADESAAQRGGFRFLLCIHLPSFGDGLFILLLIDYFCGWLKGVRIEIFVPAYLFRIAASLVVSSHCP